MTLDEREAAAIWDYIDGGVRGLTIGWREKDVIGCRCRYAFHDPFDMDREHHEPECPAAPPPPEPTE